MAQVWKIAPGEHANQWEMCHKLGCIVLGWNDLGDYQEYKNKEAIFKGLKKEYGGGKGNGAGAARSIWRFAREVKPSHIIVANEGESSVVGISVVQSGYLHLTCPRKVVQSL
jgi:predicted Mrr-cat superfamily restriction endonuclease